MRLLDVVPAPETCTPNSPERTSGVAASQVSTLRLEEHVGLDRRGHLLVFVAREVGEHDPKLGVGQVTRS
ncbi:hypothetical protein [Actinotalea sp. C106]|uniref:hypothetical protein n=1 Tax=Actinotalea sp. C106 TaxID=2908644 RepID=UPI0020284E71|nr:hypothetical protein [Actinotalea sp. C106]